MEEEQMKPLFFLRHPEPGVVYGMVKEEKRDTIEIPLSPTQQHHMVVILINAMLARDSRPVVGEEKLDAALEADLAAIAYDSRKSE